MVLILGNQTTDVKTNMMLRSIKKKNEKYNIVKRLEDVKIEYVKQEELEKRQTIPFTQEIEPKSFLK